MHKDAFGLDITAPSEAAVAAFDHTVAGYVSYRGDLALRLKALMTAAPGMAMADVFRGYMTMLSFNIANVAAAKGALAAARTSAGENERSATARERMHLSALSAWTNGNFEQTLRHWEQILDAHPRDIVAFRLHHFLAFWMGETARMARLVDKVMPAYGDGEPVTADLLACKAFAYEETGRLAEAERAGREAIRRDPGNLWAAHAVAHVLEMGGRHDEGFVLMKQLEPGWAGGGNLTHHLWWHLGLFHYERGEFSEVLGLYDRHFRNAASPLTQAQPDLYIDVQNAASMLFRLDRLGIDVGDRWTELADKAERRAGDCLSTFTLPHWVMALAAERRWDAADRLIDGMQAFAASGAPLASVVRDAALPVSQAIVARAKGNPKAALELMRPALPHMAKLGGSHAQQDVLYQVYLDCALADQADADIKRVLTHVDATYAIPAMRKRGYAMASTART